MKYEVGSDVNFLGFKCKVVQTCIQLRTYQLKREDYHAWVDEEYLTPWEDSNESEAELPEGVTQVYMYEGAIYHTLEDVNNAINVGKITLAWQELGHNEIDSFEEFESWITEYKDIVLEYLNGKDNS